MTTKSNPSRRACLVKLVQMAAAVPLASLTIDAFAAKNDALRGSLKYQDTPNAGKKCSTCTQFVAGKTPKDKGTCKIIPNDDEISPEGWCNAYVEKK